MPELARHCRVSESGLYAAFRCVKGYTPVEAWHRVLVERAEVLLTSTDLSVEEISRRLGFCPASYFRKIVRRVTGSTPRELRARARIWNEKGDYNGRTASDRSEAVLLLLCGILLNFIFRLDKRLAVNAK